jgi:hypothetical protein
MGSTTTAHTAIDRTLFLSPPPLTIRLRDLARPELMARFGARCCIEATAATLDVLRAGGVRARELPVTVMVFNAAGWRLQGQDILPGRSPVDETVWRLQGACSVGIGTLCDVPRPGHYGGHLAVLVEERWLLDVSIDQASRPEDGVNLTPLLADITPSQLELDGEVIPQVDGSVVVYRLNPTPWAGAYRRMRAWTDKRQRAEVAAAIRSALRE